MNIKLDSENNLTLIKTGISSANESFRNAHVYYVSEVVKKMETASCDVIFVLMNNYAVINTIMLKYTEMKSSTYNIYEIPEISDFSLPVGTYRAYMIIFDPVSKTHIASNVVSFSVEEGDVTEDILPMAISDVTLAQMNDLKTYISNTFDKITKLVQLNIEINKEISAKASQLGVETNETKTEEDN